MTSRSTTRFATVVAGFALLAASCGGSSGSDAVSDAVEATPEPVADATETDDSDASPGESTASVPASLQFTAPLVGGGEIDAATLAGKPTAFWFWAPT